MHDSLTIEVSLLNRGAEPIVIYDLLKWGYSGGLVLRLYDAVGSEVHRSAYDDDLIVPSTLRNPEAFVVLQPLQFLGVVRTDRALDLVRKPGLYHLQILYQSPIPKKYRNGSLPFLARECGSISSNRIPVHFLR
jgi:hypothetical protein